MDDLVTSFGEESFGLKSRKDSPISVSELPSDILLNIFFVLRRLYANDKVRFRDWTVITKICRHWRNVAVECASLWSDIRTSRHLDETRAFLERSGEMEITVNLDIRKPDDFANFDLLEGHIWRTRILEITVFDSSPRGLQNVLSAMKQHTKVLRLRSRAESYPGQHIYGWFTGLSISDPSIQLDSLSLDSLFLPWPSPLYHGLVELRISDPKGLSYRPTLEEFVAILKHCPKLQRLTLDAFSPDSSRSETKGYRIDLPLLKSIALSGMWFDDYADLLAILPIRDDVILHISISHKNINTPLHLLGNVFEKRKKCKTIQLELNKLGLTIGSNVILDSGASWTNFKVFIPDKHGALRETMTAFNNLLGDPFWQTADSVIFSFEDPPAVDPFECPNKKIWGGILNSMPASIRSLTIKYSPSYTTAQMQNSCIDLSEALAEPVVRNHMSAIDAGATLPELQELTIYCVDLENARSVFCENMLKRSMQARQTCTVRFTRPVGACMETEEFVFGSKQWVNSP